MKKYKLSFLILSFLLVLSSCTKIEPSAEPSSTSDNNLVNGSQEEIAPSEAFKETVLITDGGDTKMEPVPIGVGDTFLGWTMTDLLVGNSGLEATFSGRATLTGHLVSNDYVSSGFSFYPDPLSSASLPFWVEDNRSIWFGFPMEDVGKIQDVLEGEEELYCEIVIDSYHIDCHPTMSYNTATLESIIPIDVFVPMSNLSRALPPVEMKKGDKILGWTITSLSTPITQDELYYKITLTGNVLVQGTLFHESDEMLGDHYWFKVDESSYPDIAAVITNNDWVHDDFVLKEEENKEILQTVSLAMGESMKCQVVVSQYRIFNVPMTSYDQMVITDLQK